MDLLTQDWKVIVLAGVAAYSGLVTLASAIAKMTPNETDNKWVAKAQRLNDFLAMTTGKTKLKENLRP